MSRQDQDRKQKITIKYLARKSGYSPSTVSRALRDDPNASQETKKKILKMAKDLNYYPNLLAKGLRDKKTRTIGLILNDLKNPLYYETIDAIGQILNRKNYTLILCDSNYDQARERKNIMNMLSKGVDGIIISLVDARSDNVDLIERNNLKAVYIDCLPHRQDINYVYVDHQKASLEATDYLIEQGHRKILLLNGPPGLTSSATFARGHLQALKKHNIATRKEWIVNTDLSIENGFKAFSNFYQDRKKHNFTAILALSDILAIGIYEAAKKLKFKIPRDYSIIGYDNIISTPYLCPPLTTIHQPKIRTGTYSANILLEKIEGNDQKFTKIILQPRLIKRQSVNFIK